MLKISIQPKSPLLGFTSDSKLLMNNGNLRGVSSCDEVCFSAKTSKVKIEDISKLPKKERLKALMKFNSVDCPLVQHIIHYFTEAYPDIPKEYFRESVKKAYIEQSKTIADLVGKDKRAKLLVAKDSKTGKEIGIGALFPSGNINNDPNLPIYGLYNLCVLKEYQGKGIANKLTNKRLSQFENSTSPAFVYLEASSPAAKHMLAKRGFTPKTRNSDKFFRDMGQGCGVEDWFLMKEYNLDDKQVNSVNVIPHILDAWTRGWPDWKKYS